MSKVRTETPIVLPPIPTSLRQPIRQSLSFLPQLAQRVHPIRHISRACAKHHVQIDQPTRCVHVERPRQPWNIANGYLRVAARAGDGVTEAVEEVWEVWGFGSEEETCFGREGVFGERGCEDLGCAGVCGFDGPLARRIPVSECV
jgi:hypothetical protein